ncbi:nucleotidyl transferase AbiEii/AbiGii toxin family protein [Paenibacillus glycinis]|uniref:Nucleotidyl transferase AbiEii/AbiGii toxin family protein n=1 Tax=Paenibacillus glycinis TaxID=2697035 RepID=A0ABW9Y1R5_9BACL|nr:nucleotidyl transferase AbiEii/AbiGii toxin family protein [Paenibacillus glycinis]NBD28379.1 hypothetical protein [Paenibacillus glycinis]
MSLSLDDVKKLAIVSLFYDDELVDRFTVKGGTAINVFFGYNDRTSMDIDVSMSDDFSPDEMQHIASKLEKAFQNVFGERSYQVFDFKFFPTPKKVSEKFAGFWGGYSVEFKIIEAERYNPNELERMQRSAVVVGTGQQKRFTIDISKYEYTVPKVEDELFGYVIYIYSPLMVLYEKLRAICQQMDEYKEIVFTHSSQRARDFFDIFTIAEKLDTTEVYNPENVEILKEIFRVKRVSLRLLGNITNQREFHRDNFSAVQAAVADRRLEAYDYYFDYVEKLIEPLSYLWIEDQRETAG